MAILRRNPKWELALHQHIVSRARLPFAYGSNDCALFAADGIQAMTSVDIAADFRGYRTASGALKAIKRVTGSATVEGAAGYCAAKFGVDERPGTLLAQRGDLVLAKDEDLLLALVSLTGRELLAPGENGIKRLPLAAALRAWKVG